MKKVCVFLGMILLLSFATGCKIQSADPTETTGFVDAATGTEENTAATDGENTTAVLSAEEEFSKLIGSEFCYSRAMGCTFEKPEDIAAWYFFYMGVSNKEIRAANYTSEENAFFDETFGKIEAGEPIKLPVADINKDLALLGVTVADIQIPARWKYFDKTDAYYFVVSDAYGGPRWTVTKVEKGENGVVAVYWETTDIHFNTSTNAYFPKGTTKMILTLQLQSDNTYRVLSNLPQE